MSKTDEETYVRLLLALLAGLAQLLLNKLGHHIDGSIVVSALRNDNIGVALTGLDKLLVHGLEHLVVAVDNRLYGAATLYDIAFDYADEALVAIGIYKHLQVHLLAQFFVLQGHNALDDDDLVRLDVYGLLLAAAGQVTVDRLLHRLAGLELGDVLCEQLPIKGIGVVKVDVLTLLCRHVTAVLVVRVLRNNHYFILWHTLNEFSDHRCFARAGAARNSDNKHKRYVRFDDLRCVYDFGIQR